MYKENKSQIKIWSGEFGKKYTDRSIFSPEQLDRVYLDTWGISFTKMVKDFLHPVKKDISRVLEVGCNVGNNLNMLQKFGLDNLYGIEIQKYAIEKARAVTKGINIIESSAFDIPFKDGYFDLVFTIGVLIHISPKNIENALDEIYRCSNRYIFGFEYFSDKYEEVEYHGNRNLLWKGNFAKLYLDRYKDLKLVKGEKYKYLANENRDSMFLLEKM